MLFLLKEYFVNIFTLTRFFLNCKNDKLQGQLWDFVSDFHFGHDFVNGYLVTST